MPVDARRCEKVKLSIRGTVEVTNVDCPRWVDGVLVLILRWLFVPLFSVDSINVSALHFSRPLLY